MLTLLWGLSNDPILSALAGHLAGLGGRAILLDQRNAPESAVHLEVDPAVGGAITSGGQCIDLAEVTAVYPRPHDTRRIPAVARAGIGSETWVRALSFDQTLLTWLELTPALVVNRPSAMAANGSKPLQLMQIRRASFRTPETLVTTDPAAIAAFRRRHGEVIYKSVSGVRSKVARLREEHAERLADVAWCPTQFQRYVAGREYRVHVVADAVFACEVVSDADDYRYAERGHGGVEILPATLPLDVAERCRRLAKAIGLPVTGIDLRHGTDGGWYCLEANPSPAFTYYEQATGQPIAAAVARLLAGMPTAGQASTTPPTAAAPTSRPDN
jgi:hypothetical protein